MKNDISESYVSFNCAKLLKEKGFDCNNCKYWNCSFIIDDSSAIISLFKNEHFNSVKAPTHALAIEWIRVNFGIWIAIFYILQFDGNEESFIKFGITSKDLKNRIGKYPSTYKITILKEMFDNPNKVWDLEKYIKNKYKHFKYKPLIRFGGSATECLNFQSLNKILNDKTVCCN